MSFTSTWSVSGMTCGGCAKKLRKALLANLPGVNDARVDHASGRVELVSEGELSEPVVREAVLAAGYEFTGAAE